MVAASHTGFGIKKETKPPQAEVLSLFLQKQTEKPVALKGKSLRINRDTIALYDRLHHLFQHHIV